ncbi:MAG TPA: glycosyl hydrolase 108 family protein [Oligoflexus sp.]|uniref:glycoside hydrolase family 108 protein n=1 Tax=Oligoflexus sp. TaxID=1971216 RepID=UPI002D58A57C|nr:glycosyl hydrolase 108 family protein [Oligoflexus sp.]HYX32603.1 glycosyl hydrolase 108 family protein [Oligoflexus sp.]
MRFEDAVEVILDIEGGVANHPNDPGKLTKWGISLRAFPELGESGILNLTREDAAGIYREHYWNKVCLNIPEFLRLAVFDAAVHHGPFKAIKLLQESLNELKAGINVDGVIGPFTRRVLNRTSPKKILVQLQRERQKFLRSLSNYPSFSEGWEERVLKIAIESAALRMEI